MITFAELQNKSSKLYPAIFLEKFSNYHTRRFIRKIIFWLMILAFLAVLIGLYLPPNVSGWFSFFVDFQNQIRSAFSFFLAVWLFFHLVKAFHLSYYFRESEVDFEVAKLALICDPDDITKSFLISQIGSYTMMRLGVWQKQIDNFLQTRKENITETDFDIDINSSERKYVNVRDYGGALFDNDKEFSYFLSQYKIDRETFIGALEWVDDVEWQIRVASQWWAKSNLARIQGLGRNWSFGKVYLLEKYGHTIMDEQIYQDLGDRWRMFEKDAQRIESILVKKRDSNVVLVAPTISIGLQIVSTLGKMILHGSVLFEIEDKRIFVLDTVALIESVKDPVDLEKQFRDILSQADNAGNVILVIPNLPVFQERANEIGVDITNLLIDYLRSSRMQIVAIADNQAFHQVVEPNIGIMQYFEKVLIEDVNFDSATKILLSEANRIEANQDVFFTYQAIRAIASGAERYFVGMTYSDKILDLIDEIVVRVKSDKRKVITDEDSHFVISKKTGVPQGEISEDEKSKLKNLEEILHRRVIGQNQAIDSIADSMRRSRSGISDPKKPMGSFLFIGPTGVGKTETVKALNEIFFKSENKIIRLDMSEYNGQDAIEKLIGSYTDGTTGVLSGRIRDQQYGVLLLDEFEKTTDKVKDLFLQILDEGQFTDSKSNKINCRNLIIVATSNAGSETIYQATLAGKDLAQMKDQIINQIIDENIFKPELLNRFDGVILFHALTHAHLQKIADLMLNKLNSRIAQNGLKIKITDELINYLVKIGSDPKFGAREMNRKIKDQIESLIADKIISNEIKNGDTLIFKLNNSGLLDLVLEGNSLN